MDLLRFLKNRTDNRSPLAVQLGRRADLLSCPNTNTRMPYVDLVNEVLETAATRFRLDFGIGYLEDLAAAYAPNRGYGAGTHRQLAERTLADALGDVEDRNQALLAAGRSGAAVPGHRRGPLPAAVIRNTGYRAAIRSNSSTGARRSTGMWALAPGARWR